MYKYIRVTVVPKKSGYQDCEVDYELLGGLRGLNDLQEVLVDELMKLEVRFFFLIYFFDFIYFYSSYYLLFFFFLG